METSSKTSLISVVGNGSIEVEADMLKIYITVHRVNETLKQSQNEVNIIINDIIKILKKNGLTEKNFYTSFIDFEHNYKWKEGEKLYVGEKVKQDLICIVEDIKNNANKVASILDSLTIDNNSIELNLDFGIKENKKNRDMALKCRELAYQDGFEKAKRYAELAGLKIIKALKISETEPTSYSRNYNDCMYCETSMDPPPEEFSSTQLPMEGRKITNSMQLYLDFIAE
ncbi:hypothetical protein R83H12_00704 [Fibrobacteria bacterium R8-3-H12]